jgi:GST-like protein
LWLRVYCGSRASPTSDAIHVFLLNLMMWMPDGNAGHAMRTKRIFPVIDLYTWTTPNGRKISIALEEFGLPYTVHPIDISKDEQFAPEFLKIAPNNRIPAIVDRDTNIALMESGAILIYLADKTGKLMPKSGEGRYRVIEWLMWQMGGPGPMLGQVHHFVKYNKGKAPYAEERYLKEGHRLYKVLNTRLEGREFVADQYSIADIAIWPWISRFEWQTIDMKQYPNVRRWYETIAARPAVQKGYRIPKDMGPVPMPA